MCFRPSAMSNNNSDGMNTSVTCQTCGMQVNPEATTCPYCGDPIPQDPPTDFSEIDPSYGTRII